ncbi:MAG: RHS repeat-associated core domain-containing protein [Pirellulales bacterium]
MRVSEHPNDNIATAATSAVEYTYDAMDRRIRRLVDSNGDTAGGLSYSYQVHQGDHAHLEITDPDSLAGATAPTMSRRYLYGEAVDQILASDDLALNVRWALADHEGTIRDVLDGAGALVHHRKYDSFGKSVDGTTPAADFLFGYAGRPLDPNTGLYDNRARWYDPGVGRFASEDPSGLTSDMNLYRYAGNSPVDYTDPSGLCYIGTGSLMGGFLGQAASTFVGSISQAASTVNSWASTAGSYLDSAASWAGNMYSAGSAGLAAGQYLGNASNLIGWGGTSRQAVGGGAATPLGPSTYGDWEGSAEGIDVARGSLQAAIKQTAQTNDMAQRLGNGQSQVPVSTINGIRDAYPGSVDYAQVSPDTLAGALCGSRTTKAVVSVPGESGPTAYTYRLVEPWFDSPYYQLESTRGEANRGETAQAMRDSQNEILQRKIAFANAYANVTLNTMTVGMSLENVGMQSTSKLISTSDSRIATFLSRLSGNGGEEAAAIVKNTTRIDSLTGTAAYRVPDVLTKTVIGDVKNVSRLSYTNQLKDYAAYAAETGRTFELYVRRSTKLSSALKQAVNSGRIVLKHIPGTK